MRKLLYLAACLAYVCLASAAAWRGSTATAPAPNPDDGSVTQGIFRNAYFNLSFPLPPGWTVGIAGPGPSITGYYVLATFVPAGELTGTILIVAQDMFFAAKPSGDDVAMTDALSRAMSEVAGMTIDRPPSEVQIAGRRFGRVDFSGVGLFRSTLITQIRCHLVGFNLTAKSPALLADLVLSLGHLGYAGDNGARRTDPKCMSNYADAEHLLAKVDPPAISPAAIPIPIRIIIGADGAVEHVHVIRASGAQRDAIENALGQWKFKPHQIGGNATAIETGLLIEFTPTGGIKYSAGNRGRL
jgi:hypothetical protein